MIEGQCSITLCCFPILDKKLTTIGRNDPSTRTRKETGNEYARATEMRYDLRFNPKKCSRWPEVTTNYSHVDDLVAPQPPWEYFGGGASSILTRRYEKAPFSG